VVSLYVTIGGFYPGMKKIAKFLKTKTKKPQRTRV